MSISYANGAVLYLFVMLWLIFSTKSFQIPKVLLIFAPALSFTFSSEWGAKEHSQLQE